MPGLVRRRARPGTGPDTSGPNNPALALPGGSDPKAVSRVLRAAHEAFVVNGAVSAGLRQVVLDSWRRSLRGGVDPETTVPPVDLVDDDLRAYRDAHPLAPVMPVIRSLLVNDADAARRLIAVSDADGRLLWVEGAPSLRDRAARMHFVEGASWDERHAGTNAPGTAVAIDQAIQVFAAEHFSRIVQPWSCAAAPVHDPDTGEMLGAIDVTGGDEIGSPHTLALVRTAAAVVERELRLMRLSGSLPNAPSTDAAGAELSVLGRDQGVLRSAGRPTRLSPRHSELVLLLARHPAGLTAAELDVALHENDGSLVTVRAEMSRLRPLLGAVGLHSRPYRLDRPPTTDIDVVRGHLRRGALREALHAYVGPVLPRSPAPAVVAIRDDLRAHLRTALLADRRPELLMSYARSADGQADVEIWQACLGALPHRSTQRVEVSSRLIRLDRELGAYA